jgi:hypothetical protein
VNAPVKCFIQIPDEHREKDIDGGNTGEAQEQQERNSWGTFEVVEGFSPPTNPDLTLRHKIDLKPISS